MNFVQLKAFLSKKMQMQHIYQPVMIKALLESEGKASVEKISKAFLAKDQSQIDYYKEITKNMPGKVLRNHKIVDYKDGFFNLNIPKLDSKQKAELISICNEKIKEYESQFGKNIWKHRARDSRVVPGSLRYQVLKKAKARCELCGIPADQKALDVDHILPVNKGGKTVIENLQALCYTCNSQKSDRDDTDFRPWKKLYDSKKSACPFCKLEKTAKDETALAFAIKDKYPVTANHMLICPKRHVSSFFELGASEHKACLALLSQLKEKITQNDKTVTSFNIGINDGKEAGQTISHCHIHLIPRRKGDVKNPRGGIRNTIPGKGVY